MWLWFGVQWVCNSAHPLSHPDAKREEEQTGTAPVTAKALAGARGHAGGQQEGIIYAHKCSCINFVGREDCATPVTVVSFIHSLFTKCIVYYLGKKTCGIV